MTTSSPAQRRTRRRILPGWWFGLIVISLTGGVATSEEVANPKEIRIVLLFATCTMNKNYLSPYNDRIDFTPNLERMSRTGAVTATAHRAEASLSGVSYASLFTGRKTSRHGIFRHPGTIPEDVPVITEIFAGAGWDVMSFFGHKITQNRGYDRGTPRDLARNERLKAGDRLFQKATLDLHVDPTKRLLIVANDLQLHDYNPDSLAAFCEKYPAQCADRSPSSILRDQALFYDHRYDFQFEFEKTVTALGLSAADRARLIESVDILYRATVYELDLRLGKILKHLEWQGFMDQTLVVFTADHGESHFRTDREFQWAHLGMIETDVVGVPLIIVDPRWKGPRRFESVSRSIDVLPTIAALAGIELEPSLGIDGIDLSAALTGTVPAPSLSAYSHTGMLPLGDAAGNGAVKQRFWRSPGASAGVAFRVGDRTWSIPSGTSPEIVKAFDLSTDPHESHSMYDEGIAEHKEMADDLRAYQRALEQGFAKKHQVEEAVMREDPERHDREESKRLEELRALGYVE